MKAGSPGASRKRSGSDSHKKSLKEIARSAVAIGAIANSHEVQARKTAAKLQPLVDKGLVHPGHGAFTIKCKGVVLPTTASLSDAMEITLDDDDATPIQSINALKTCVFAKHGVESSTNAWMVIFHGGYSLHTLRAALEKPEEGAAPPAVGLQPGELPEDADDSPEVTDPTLTAPGCPYQQAIAAVHDDALSELDNAVLHAALRSVIASNDNATPEALAYLFAAGAPLESLPGEEPFAVLAARRHEHPAYTEMLISLASANVDFETSAMTGESAADIVNARVPRLLKRVLKKAEERSRGL